MRSRTKQTVWQQTHDLQKEKLVKWTCLKLKMAALWKTLVRGWKDKLQWEKIPNKGLVPTYTKNSQKWTGKKQKIQTENGPKTWRDTSPKQIHRWQTGTWQDVQHH